MIHIKHPSLDQLPALAQLFDAYRVFYRKKTDLVGAITFLTERFERKESVLFVAEIDLNLVGFTQLYPLFFRPTWKKCGYLMICMYIQITEEKMLASYL